MASRKSKRKVFAPDFKKMSLNLDEVICPICLCVLIEPVTMPCSHELCMPCFKKNVQETSLQCPICRRRIATWSRKASRDNSLVNQERWELIRKSFPEKVRRRLNEEESDDNSSECELVTNGFQQICEPGEIRKEYEAQLKQAKEEEAKEKEEEMQKSEALIHLLQEKDREEEEKRKKEQLQLAEKDGMIAMLLAQRLNEVNSLEESTVIDSVLENINTVLRPRSSSSTGASTSAKHMNPNNKSPSSYATKSLKKRHASSSFVSEENEKKCKIQNDNEIPSSSKMLTGEKSCFEAKEKCSKEKNLMTNEIQSAGKTSGKLSRSGSMESVDSISPELCHFRPIKTAPKTPPLRLPDGRVVEPKLVHAMPRNLSLHMNAGLGLQRMDVSTQAVLKKRLLKVEHDRQNKASALLKSAVVTRIPVSTKELKFGESFPLKQPGKPLALVSSSPGNCSHSQGGRIPSGVKPTLTGCVSGFKFASSYLAANKENPKVNAPIVKRLYTRKKKSRNELVSSKRLADDGQSSSGIQRGLDVTTNVANSVMRKYPHNSNKFGHPQKLHYGRNGSTMASTVTGQLQNVNCNLTSAGHVCSTRTTKRELKGSTRVEVKEKQVMMTRLSLQRQQEAADYLFALKLQQEWDRRFTRQYNTVNRRQGTYGEYNLRRRRTRAIC